MEEKKQERKIAWYFRPPMIAAAILVFGPLGLFLLWFRPGTDLYLKIVISVIVIVATFWMTTEAVKYYQLLLSHYRELAGTAGSM